MGDDKESKKDVFNQPSSGIGGLFPTKDSQSKPNIDFTKSEKKKPE